MTDGATTLPTGGILRAVDYAGLIERRFLGSVSVDEAL
jgi:hypothetical protein